FEQDGEVVVDSICYENFPAIDHHLDFREIEFSALPPGQLWRFQLNLKAQKAQRQLLEPRCCEFPYIHPERMGQPYEQVYLAVAHQAEGNAPLQGILKLDLSSGARELWSAAPRGFVGEPVFVPRDRNNVDPPLNCETTLATQEAEGWVLTLVYDAAHHRTDVVILAADRLGQGPIARLHLKHHIPYGLHGSFTPEYFGPLLEK
ncbi:MAG TPA: carotenoid oxygenase family protein, partial [Candidatus Caenarcaniphilales bacterium]